MAGFRFRKSLDAGQEAQKLWCNNETVIANSAAIRVGDAVKQDANGFITTVSAGDKILGFVHGVVGKNYERLDPDSGFLDKYTVASDNQTVGLKRAIIDVSKNSLYENTADGALTRAGQDTFYDVASANQVSATPAANGALKCHQIDPDNDGSTTKGLFAIAESQRDPYAQV